VLQPDLVVLPTAALAAQAAAARFVAAANEAIRTHGAFVVALSGGATPRELYVRLAMEPDAGAVDWSRVQIVWGDERCVPPDHPDSNYRMAREALLDHLSIPTGNVHRIRGEADPAQAAGEYEQMLRGLLQTPVGRPRIRAGARIDLVLLGLGTDGHTASLFPGATEIQESASWVRAGYVPTVSAWRVTLTPILLNAAAEVAFLVTGSAKAAIVRQVLEGVRQPDLFPAQAIAPVAGRVSWFLDRLAAAELRGREAG